MRSLLFLLCSLFVSAAFSSECKYENLPVTLDVPGFLAYNQEIHIHNTFRVDFSTHLDPITFSLSSSSYFRMYVAPHEVDIDIILTSEDNYFKTSELEIETMIFDILPEGKYQIALIHHAHVDKHDDCSTVIVEIAIVPETDETVRTRKATNQMACTGDRLPYSFIFEPLSQGRNVDYSSNDAGDVYFVASQGRNDEQDTLRVVDQIQFTIPPLPGRQNLWAFKATIRTDFITGASVGISLTAGDVVNLTRECIMKEDCTTGTAMSMNSKSIRELIGPGNYTFWFYDLLEFRNPELLPCSPFDLELSIAHVTEVEDFVNCPVVRLPDTFNRPGYLDQGFMYLSQSIFMDVGKTFDVPFTVKETSLFRVFVADNNIDIDVSLKSVDRVPQLSLFSNRAKGEEAIQAYLDPGRYTLSYSFLFSKNLEFCQLFDTQIAIAPSASQPGLYCQGGQKRVDPDLSGLTTLDGTSTWSLNRDSSSTFYYYNYNGNYSTVTILEVPFTVKARSKFEAIAYTDFLVGDLSLQIIYQGLKGNVSYLGEHQRNRIDLTEFFDAGDYVFVLTSGIRENRPVFGQGVDRLGNYFPGCIKYELEVHVVPEAALATTTPSPFVFEDPVTCPYRVLPKDFDGVEFLGLDYHMHIQENFRIVFASSSMYSVEDIYFTTPNDILVFRLFAEPHYHDIDFWLYEIHSGGTEVEVQKSASILEEEKMAVLLKKGTSYHFKVTVIRYPDHDDTKCEFYNLELAIYSAVTGDSLEDCRMILPSVLSDLKTGNLFQFPQSTQIIEDLITFEVATPTYFSAMMFYDFVWNDLYLRLMSLDKDTQDTAKSLAVGANVYNANAISSILLQPGMYGLQINEPMTVDPSLRRCALFNIGVWMKSLENTTASMDKNILLGCTDATLPATFNSIGYSSSLSGNQLHFQDSILVNVADRYDRVGIRVVEKSVFRVFVPPHPLLDIDLRLYSGTVSAPGPVIDSSTSSGEEESILQVIDVGDYFFQVNFYRLAGTNGFPGMDECPSFPLEISLNPLTYVTDQMVVMQKCRSTKLNLVFNEEVEFPIQHDRSKDRTFHAKYGPITVQDKGYVRFAIGFDFATADTMVELTGVLATGQHVRYVASLAQNHRVLEQLLVAGSYNLSLHDPSISSSGYLPGIGCQTMFLSYFIELDGSPPSYLCQEFLPFPTDAYSSEGNSGPLGGPQNAVTGETWIRGDEFLMPSSGVRLPFKFMIEKPSFVRVAAWGENRESIEIFLYKDASESLLEHVSSDSSSDDYPVQSALWANATSPPSSNPYMLELQFKSIETESRCAHFAFDFAVQNIVNTKKYVTCPADLPSSLMPFEKSHPPHYVPISKQVSILMPSVIYYITKDAAMQNEQDGMYIYTLLIDTNDPLVSVVADVEFNFIAADITLSLSTGADGKVKATGSPYVPKNVHDGFNFGCHLQAMLMEQGMYYLDIRISVEEYHTMFADSEDWCIPFSFSLFLLADVSSSPSILYISPEAGANFNPKSDLVITIDFSEPIATPAPDDINKAVIEQLLVILTLSGTSTVIPPRAAYHSKNNNQLTVVFDHSALLPSSKYDLHVAAHSMLTSSGKPFAPPTPVTYSTGGCTCGGHGVCDSKFPNEDVCFCEEGWQPPHCDECADGYHPAGSLCFLDTHCDNSTCHSSQPCVEIGGIAQCVCGPEYAGETCDRCADGYDGFPDCVPEGLLGSMRPKGCQASLLPSTLNTIAYLKSDHGLGSGHMHLQGPFYIPVPSADGLYIQETNFSVSERSIIRVTVSARVPEYSMWLLSVGSDGHETPVAATSSFSAKGIIFFGELKGSPDAPVDYKIRFRFRRSIPVDPGYCERMNLELEVAPMSLMQGILLKTQPSLCGSAEHFPFQEKSYLTRPYTLNAAQTFVYSTGQTYNVRSTHSRDPHPHFFYNWSFTIPRSKGNNFTPKLTAEVGHRFVSGQIALLLVKGKESDPSKCTLADAGNSVCVLGESALNRDILETFLVPGNYTLFFFEPVPQLMVEYESSFVSWTDCAPFDFSFRVEWVEDETIKCDVKRPPSDLFDPFEDPPEEAGRHLVADYYLATFSSMRLNVTKESMIRIGVQPTHDGVLYLGKWDGSWTDSVTIKANVGDSLSRTIFPGTYFVNISSLYDEVGLGGCPTFTIEAALLPSEYVEFPVCDDEDIRRSFPPSLTKLPYIYIADRLSLFAMVPQATNPVSIWKWYFAVSEDVIFEMELTSSFLLFDLNVVLVWAGATGGGRIEQYRGLSYNFLELKRELGSGAYSVEIFAASDLYKSSTCAEFSLNIVIMSKNEFDNAVCLKGDSLPYMFDSERFLGSSPAFHYSSNDWIVPNFDGVFSGQSISFSAPDGTASSLRVFTQYQRMNIDFVLRDITKFDNITVVAKGSENQDLMRENGYPAETLLFILRPSSDYILEINFLNSDRIPLNCETFPMEMSIMPLPMLTDATTPQCPRGGSDNWGPSSFKSSVTQLDDLYFQQSVSAIRSRNYTITRSQIFDLYAEAMFDFATGQLMMRLTSSGLTYLSSASYDAAVLSLTELPPGTYTLTVSETRLNFPQFVQCSHFSLYIETADSSYSVSALSTLPPSLSRIPLLSYDGEMNLQESVLLPTGQTEMKFSVNAKSTLRFSLAVAEESVGLISLALRPPHAMSTYFFQEDDYFYGLMDAELDSGVVYSLDITTSSPKGASRDAFSAFASMSVVPSQHYTDSQLPVCESASNFPEIYIDPSKESFSFAADYLAAPVNKTGKTAVFVRSFHVRSFSKIFVTLGFNFPLDEMSLELWKVDMKDLIATGTRDYNRVTLDEYIDPGDYVLVITSFQSYINVYYWPQKCAMFSADVSIHEADSGSSACTSLYTFPANLNDAAGGSDLHGGPLDEKGYLHFSFDSFYLRKIPSTYETTLSVKNVSLLSFYVETEAAWSVTLSVTLDGKELSALNFRSEKGRALKVVRVGGGSASSAYVLRVRFDETIQEGECQYFGADIKVIPTSFLDGEVVCDTEADDFPFRADIDTNLKVDDEGVGSQNAIGFFPSVDHEEIGDIFINVTTPSLLTVTVGFDSVISEWSFSLDRDEYTPPEQFRRNEPNWQSISQSELSAFGESFSQINLYSSLSASLSTPGMYRLRFVRRGFLYREQVVCEPLQFSLFLLPNVYIEAVAYRVEPPSALSLAPEKDFHISVYFTYDLYTAKLERATSADVQSAFFLISRKGDVVLPLFAEGGGKFWTVTFPGRFLSDMSYFLQLKRDILYSYEVINAALVSAHEYRTMDTSCGNHGSPHKEGLCVCNVGFVGRSCSACTDGYHAHRSNGTLKSCTAVGDEFQTIGFITGLFLATVVLVVNVLWLSYQAFQQKRNDPFLRSFTWDTDASRDSTSLLDEDEDAQILDIHDDDRGSSEESKNPFGLVGDDDDEEDSGL